MREALSYSFLIPPTIFIVISLCGAIIVLLRPRTGAMIVLASSIFLYLFATPAVSMLLVQHLTSLVPISNVALTNSQAIVVPGVDIKWGNGADIPSYVGLQTLERLARTAQLYRRLRLPVVVSGGGRSGISLANLMRQELEQNFQIPVQYVEDKSFNTYENALYTSRVLKADNINNVIVVAQARDMPRILWSFRKVGMNPAPYVLRDKSTGLGVWEFLPSTRALLESFYAMHEMIGLAYYKVFY
jgi:uncharacterized SAM-binding protein YcdF (DUF218 family)